LRGYYNYNTAWRGAPNGNNRGQNPINQRFIYSGKPAVKGAIELVTGAVALTALALF